MHPGGGGGGGYPSNHTDYPTEKRPVYGHQTSQPNQQPLLTPASQPQVPQGYGQGPANYDHSHYQQPRNGAVPRQGYQPGQRATGTAGQTAARAGAYGGSEVGSLVGGAVGPPIIGPIVGNIVGDKVGTRAIREAGLDTVAGQFHEDLSRVVGKERADKVGEIAGTALGFAESEYCICCPCMPASQVLFFVMTLFFIFNWYRLGIGIEFEYSCTEGGETHIKNVPYDQHEASLNETQNYWLIKNDTSINVTTYLISYQCEFGFHYLVAGASVWIFFLPFYILTLFGNCWRQCCCCFCDPVVCCATIFDCFKRCLCEVGRFSVLDFIWYSMCAFQVIWGCMGLYWLVKLPGKDHQLYDHQYRLIPTVITAVVLDLFLAGSELVHKVRLHAVNRQRKESEQLQMNDLGAPGQIQGQGQSQPPSQPGSQPSQQQQQYYQGHEGHGQTSYSYQGQQATHQQPQYQGHLQYGQ